MNPLIYVFLIICLGGLFAYLLNRAPFIEGEFKQIGVWVILVAVIVICVTVLFPGVVPSFR